MSGKRKKHNENKQIFGARIILRTFYFIYYNFFVSGGVAVDITIIYFHFGFFGELPTVIDMGNFSLFFVESNIVFSVVK